MLLLPSFWASDCHRFYVYLNPSGMSCVSLVSLSLCTPYCCSYTPSFIEVACQVLPDIAIQDPAKGRKDLGTTWAASAAFPSLGSSYSTWRTPRFRKVGGVSTVHPSMTGKKIKKNPVSHCASLETNLQQSREGISNGKQRGQMEMVNPKEQEPDNTLCSQR